MAIHVACALSILMGFGEPVAAQDCRLALILALDVSSSVDSTEDQLQREGLADALAAPEVVDAFLMGDPVALYVFEWSDAAFQRPLLPGWTMIKAEADLVRAAEVIARHARLPDDRLQVHTAIGAALGHAAQALENGPECRARTIDVAGDGENNAGIEPEVAYQTFPLDGVTVNALIVGHLGDASASGNLAADQRATRHYDRLVGAFQREILHGPGAFWIFSDGYEDYQRAMTAKLLRELELPAVSGWPASADAG